MVNTIFYRPFSEPLVVLAVFLSLPIIDLNNGYFSINVSIPES